ncbi:MAG: DUF642 domain-containing protein, partial [Pseudomonadota bacterium]
DTPVISNTPATDIDYIHRSPSVLLTPTADINDIDNTELSALTVRLLNYEPGVDLLSIDSAGLSQNWDAANGVLSLSGNATITEYRDALRTLVYESDSGPAGGAVTTRSIEITVTDSNAGTSTAVPVDVSLQVPPYPIIVTNSGAGTAVFVEDSAALNFTDLLTVTSVDSRHITGATLHVDNYYLSEDQLLFTDTPQVSGVWDADNGILTLSGDTTAAIWQSALRTVGYINSSGDPATETRSIIITLESSSGTSDPLTVPVQVVSVNDAPLAADGGITFSSDAVYRFTAADFGFSDPTENHLFHAVLLQQLPTDGQVVLGDTEVSPGDNILISDISAGLLRYVPLVVSDTTTRTLEFRVQDDGGTDNGGIDQSQSNNLLSLTLIPGEITSVVADEGLPFEVAENTPLDALVGNLASLHQDDLFMHQRGGDFAGADRSSADYTRYSANGSHAGATLDQWLVVSGNVDLRGPAWSDGPLGGIALDLNGNTPGQITQQITTVPGAQYEIAFYVSGNFLQMQTGDKFETRVSAAGQQHDVEVAYLTDWSKTNLQWRQESMIFTAIDTVTDVSFTSLNAGS